MQDQWARVRNTEREVQDRLRSHNAREDLLTGADARRLFTLMFCHMKEQNRLLEALVEQRAPTAPTGLRQELTRTAMALAEIFSTRPFSEAAINQLATPGITLNPQIGQALQLLVSGLLHALPPEAAQGAGPSGKRTFLELDDRPTVPFHQLILDLYHAQITRAGAYNQLTELQQAELWGETLPACLDRFEEHRDALRRQSPRVEIGLHSILAVYLADPELRSSLT